MFHPPQEKTSISKINEHEGRGPKKMGLTNTTAESFLSSNNDLPNDISPLFTTNQHKWFQKYQMLFQFYLVHAHYCNMQLRKSLAERASYQRTKLVQYCDKYDPKF
jgi:hypothetical protein